MSDLMRENARLRKALSEKQAGQIDEQSIMRDNVRMKAKLGEPISTEEALRARGVKIQTAREWHEGQRSE